ncbi:hypothetical protein [Herbiconiux sp. YIM B11900]|uniref:hypothetical protein n=1 Tax=Herbiconiux sp. YIM B11900 TaxID=3404131 RepID=UPI003F86C234
MPENVTAWWERRQRSKGCETPYPVGRYREAWRRYPVLVRQYHPEFNAGRTLSQIPPAADVYLTWQCDAGHLFVATPSEQRSRPSGGRRRRSVWCPVCAELAVPTRVVAQRGHPLGQEPERVTPSAAVEPPAPTRRASAQGTLDVRRPPGTAFWSARAPRPASAVEAGLRQRLGEHFAFDLTPNAVAVGRPFFGRHEVWPDIVIDELRIALEYDTVGRFGLEHVGPREDTDRRKDRLLREAGWEVVRIRCRPLLALGPHDLVVSGVTAKLVDELAAVLGALRGELFVEAYRR